MLKSYALNERRDKRQLLHEFLRPLDLSDSRIVCNTNNDFEENKFFRPTLFEGTFPFLPRYSWTLACCITLSHVKPCRTIHDYGTQHLHFNTLHFCICVQTCVTQTTVLCNALINNRPPCLVIGLSASGQGTCLLITGNGRGGRPDFCECSGDLATSTFARNYSYIIIIIIITVVVASSTTYLNAVFWRIRSSEDGDSTCRLTAAPRVSEDRI